MVWVLTAAAFCLRMTPNLTEPQQRRLAAIAEAKRLCEEAGCVTKLEGLGVLLIVTPDYGPPGAEQLLIEATEPTARPGGQTRRSIGEG